MQLELKKHLSDISSAIDNIQAFTLNITSLKSFSENLVVKRAVERELEIIGEAMSRILVLQPDVEISNARKIINTRNRIIHGYDVVDDSLIWAIIIKHLPVLKDEVIKLIGE